MGMIMASQNGEESSCLNKPYNSEIHITKSW